MYFSYNAKINEVLSKFQIVHCDDNNMVQLCDGYTIPVGIVVDIRNKPSDNEVLVFRGGIIDLYAFCCFSSEIFHYLMVNEYLSAGPDGKFTRPSEKSPYVFAQVLDVNFPTIKVLVRESAIRYDQMYLQNNIKLFPSSYKSYNTKLIKKSKRQIVLED